ncbi:hypothetical protein SLE2022_224140 [Rubroshorea leprosula]
MSSSSSSYQPKDKPGLESAVFGSSLLHQRSLCSSSKNPASLGLVSGNDRLVPDVVGFIGSMKASLFHIVWDSEWLPRKSTIKMPDRGQN